MSKYRNKKCCIDGILFDSKKEAHRYCELKLLEKVGIISDLRRQVPFTLVPSQRDIKTKKVLEREVKYIADFVYQEKENNSESHIVVEDVKSDATRTPDYIIKRKLMLKEYGIRIKEI